MDLEELSKTQIILLTLLVSFVTSIATGIVAVSLMNQAPPAIAQTVNRVIEETVQKAGTAGQPAAAGSTQEKTVIVDDSDLVAQAVAATSPSVVRIYADDGSTFLGLGFVSAPGQIVTDSAALAGVQDAIVAVSGTTTAANVTYRDSSLGLAFLSATSSPQGISWSPVSFSKDAPILGESVVVFGGEKSNRVEQGLITELLPLSDASSSSNILDTDIGSDSILDGSPVIDTQGAIMGVSTEVSRASSPSGFIPAALISADAAAALKDDTGSQL